MRLCVVMVFLVQNSLAELRQRDPSVVLPGKPPCDHQDEDAYAIWKTQDS